MRSITNRGWIVILLLTLFGILVMSMTSAPRDEADVPSYREHRQGAIMRDSDIEATSPCWDHPPLRCISR